MDERGATIWRKIYAYESVFFSFFLFLFFITFLLRFLTKYSVKLTVIFDRNSATKIIIDYLLIARRNDLRNVVLLLSKISITLLLSTPVICHHHDVSRLFDFPWPLVARITKISPKDKNNWRNDVLREKKNVYYSERDVFARRWLIFTRFSRISRIEIWNIRSS